MTVELPLPPALRARTILWVEDYPEDLDGTLDYLEYVGQEITLVGSYEAGVRAVQRDEFDLIVVDQQLPMQGRKTDDAGSRLIFDVKAGELDSPNRETPFLFITGSSDWVLDCPIDVEDLPGFLDIQEKGGDLLEWFFDNLPDLPKRDSAPIARPSGPARPVGGVRAKSEAWRGIVCEVDADNFRARLVDEGGALPDHEAKLPRAAVAPRDQDAIIEGAQFTWFVEMIDDDAGTRSVRSRLDFLRTPSVSNEEISEALDRARALRARDLPPDPK